VIGRNRYLILDVLGQGTFGQVVKCQNLKTQEVVAVKVIKNRTAYFNQSMMEVSVLDLLNTKLDKNDDHHLLRLKDTFIHRQHLCLVFELLSVNLYELIKQNQFRGLSTTLVRVFAQQLLNGLALLNKARLIHCDLKPENILLKNLESPIIKIIDFGSACDERQTVYTYIQSRFYRSPEVLLGLPYSSAIDMWSLGCIVVELFLGLPLFPGSSEYNQVSRIVEMLGNPPNWMIEVGKQAGDFFEKRQDEFGRKTYHLKSMEQYSRERGTKEQPSKKYFQANTLPEIIKSYPMPRKNMKQNEIDRGENRHHQRIGQALILTTICRNEQSNCIYRLRSGSADYQPAGEMVPAAGEAPSFHHSAKVHWTLCATDEPEGQLSQPIASSWHTTATASRRT
jgi:dual specificity protein kinase YAK1